MQRNLFPSQEHLRGFSRALFSTWLYHRRFNILFDAGEGVATMLLNRVFGIRRVFLSHGHADHIAGLINLINLRNLGAGDQTATLEIYYPRGNRLIELMKQYLAQTQNELSFSLEWRPIEAGQIIDLDPRRGKIFLKSFATQHSSKQLSLGFNIVEKRRRLRPEFQGKSQLEINQMIRQHGKEQVAENFEQIIFSYGGDSRPINPEQVTGSLLLCHECTYLKLEDDERNFQQHSVLDEVLEVAKRAQVKGLLLFHLSLRYSFDEIRQMVNQAVERIDPGCRVLILYGDRFCDPADTSMRRRFKDEAADEEEEPEVIVMREEIEE